MNQIVKIFSRHEFESLARQHHVGQKFRSYNRWSQFIAMIVAQLSSRGSLRDLTENLKAQKHKLYHLGMRDTFRATLARVNEKQPYTLYQAVFYKLFARCRAFAPKHKFNFKAKLYLLDATIIDLCLSLFPWAAFRKTKGAIKLHVGLDADGYLPEFIAVTCGKSHEIAWAKALKLPKGSFVVFDRGFTDYGWYQSLIEAGIFFVTRLKSNALALKLKQRPGRRAAGIICDRRIRLIDLPYKLRLVVYVDRTTGKEYQFLTNADHIPANTIAELYKERWRIELFFKWIKQNLKIKTFLGTSKNAALTQIWIALCVYLILAYIKFSAKLKLTFQQILRLLQLNLFERRNLISLFKPPDTQLALCKQLPLWSNL
jgi:hypothetical protein